MPVESLSPRILVVRYFLFVILFLFETRYILQLKKAKRNNQPNKRYPQCLVYTCNLCLQNSVKTQLTKKYQLNRQHSNFFFYNFCIFLIYLKKRSTKCLPVVPVYTFQDVPVSILWSHRKTFQQFAIYVDKTYLRNLYLNLDLTIYV